MKANKVTAVVDPFDLKEILWPQVTFYREQEQIIRSIWDNDETIVPAGNMLGKDFVAGFIVLAYFLTRHPCRIVTTSVVEKHLNVLWGEVEKFLRISKYPLILGEKREVNGEMMQGSALTINDDGMRRVWNGKVEKDCYVMKKVATEKTIESFQGHHVTPDPGQPIDSIPRNLFVSDESSGMPDIYYTMAKTWAKRVFLFGNTWPCQNYFRRSVEGDPSTDDPGGDLPRDTGGGYRRKVIRIKGEDSPNVRLATMQAAKDEVPTGEVLVPGVLNYNDYQARRRWPKHEQTVVLDAEWPNDPSDYMYPMDWVALSERRADVIAHLLRTGDAMGCDPAYGGDNTSWTIVNGYGLVEQLAKKTADTSVVPDITIELMRRHGIAPECVFFDYGGGGKPHVDILRRRGYNVSTVNFGAAVSPVARRKGVIVGKTQRVKEKEQRYAYLNRRAQLYHALRQVLDPKVENPGAADPASIEVFALPKGIMSRKRMDGGPCLRDQMRPIPLMYDQQGRILLPPKSSKPGKVDGDTIVQRVGCSPDELESLLLGLYGVGQGVTQKQSLVMY